MPPLEPPAGTACLEPTADSTSRATRRVLLLEVVRSVVRADSDPARQALFANLMQSRRSVRLAYELHQRLRGTWGSALLVAGFGLVCFLRVAAPRNRGARVLAVAQHANARQQVARVFTWIGSQDCALVRTGLTALLAPIALPSIAARRGPGRGRVVTLLRIARRLDDRHGFLVTCRASAAVAWYARSLAILRDGRPGAVLVSSDSNPEEVGFLAAARALAIPQVFVSHAYPTPLAPPLAFDLSILEGEAAVLARRRKGPVKGAVILAGMEGESATLDPGRFTRARPVIGVFTSKALSWATLAAVLNDCRQHFDARQIVIRWHPSMLAPARLPGVLGDLSGVVVSPRAAALADVARQCDWVIADENSNVHLPVLKLGIPTVAVKNLGVYPESRADQYGFVANGIVFPPVRSVRDIRAETLVAFFSSGWSSRFQQYDAAYLRPQGATGAEVRRAIWALFEPAATRAAAT